MEEAARRYARRILVLHIVALALVIGLVGVAGHQIFGKAYQQAVEQTSIRQELLAVQMAGGIAGQYQALVNDLTLLRNAVEANRMAVAFQSAEHMWPQFEGRISEIYFVMKGNPSPVKVVPADRAEHARQMTVAQQKWLDELQGPDISLWVKAEEGMINLVAVPVGEAGRLVVVVPLKFIQAKFLASVNIKESMSANLMDEHGTIIASNDRTLVGFNTLRGMSSAGVREEAVEYLERPMVRSMVYEKGLTLDGNYLPPRIVSAAPLRIGPTTWTILITSQLSDQDKVLGGLFRRVMWWGGFVVVSVTGILVSTAIQMIRGRVRLERMAHEMLERELNQARSIQERWLPHDEKPAPAITVAAINRPANHISGDFYNWFDMGDGRTMVMIGDVTGHGMPAAFLMATTQMLTRSNMRQMKDPGKCLNEINYQLCQQVFSGQFVTMLICVVDQPKRQLQLAIAGHYPPIVRQGSGEYAQVPAEPQIVLGVDPTADYETQVFDLGDDASVVLYTDGVLDVIAPDGDRFEADRMWQVLKQASRQDPQKTIDAMLAAVDDFRGPRELKDDLTMVVMQVKGTAS